MAIERMRPRIELARYRLLWRYYQAGIVNTAVGFGLYAAFVRLGLNPYLAQLVSHLIGMAWNYLSYSRHVFSDAAPAKLRFVAAYLLNYLVSLATLKAASLALPSPYLAGAASILLTSLLNFFVLRHAVFRPRAA